LNSRKTVAVESNRLYRDAICESNNDIRSLYSYATDKRREIALEIVTQELVLILQDNDLSISPIGERYVFVSVSYFYYYVIMCLLTQSCCGIKRIKRMIGLISRLLL